MISKKQRCASEMVSLWEAYFETGDAEDLLSHLVANSNLPGRRANLELAHAFADLAERFTARDALKVWDLCVPMVDVPVAEAPVDDPREFIPFCGAIGIGAAASVSDELRQKGLRILQSLASDPRWRMREGVRFGLQRLLKRHTRTTLRELDTWIRPVRWLEMRAAAAAVADPSALDDKGTAVSALQLQRKILRQVAEADNRQSDAFKTLRKGLAYTLSVVVSAIPDEGFALMAELAGSGDSDVLWIVKQNLKKKRLTGKFPAAVKSLERQLGS